MRCLLASDFTEIMRSGELKLLSDELSMAEKNRGKDLKVPEMPRIKVLLHENAAVAYGRSFSTSKDGRTEIRWYSDTYLWKDGQWRAFFAQQTAAAAEAFINETATARRKIAISTISLAEVVYLVEKSRLPTSADDELAQALADPEHVFAEAVISATSVQAMRQVPCAEVQDMPDRIMAATAVYFNVPVISRDRRIRAATLKTIW